LIKERLSPGFEPNPGTWEFARDRLGYERLEYLCQIECFKDWPGHTVPDENGNFAVSPDWLKYFRNRWLLMSLKQVLHDRGRAEKHLVLHKSRQTPIDELRQHRQTQPKTEGKVRAMPALASPPADPTYVRDWGMNNNHHSTVFKEPDDPLHKAWVYWLRDKKLRGLGPLARSPTTHRQGNYVPSVFPPGGDPAAGPKQSNAEILSRLPGRAVRFPEKDRAICRLSQADYATRPKIDMPVPQHLAELAANCDIPPAVSSKIMRTPPQLDDDDDA
jgi:hypothetical protein